jgi:predicted SprT family Zn-dependent metalloprotease
MKPTTEQAQAYQGLYEYFNKELFGDVLSDDVMLNFSRKGQSFGFFRPIAWQGESEATLGEISLNPDHMKRGLEPVCGTLVHAMVHKLQHEQGTPSSGKGHNREWGEMMKRVGLYPSSTAQPGGKETGDKVSHYVIEGGVFDLLMKKLPSELKFPFMGLDGTIQKVKKTPKKSKFRYACGECGMRVWAKEGVNVVCGECGVELKMEGGMLKDDN